jgi:hypothetical protein
VDGEEGLGDHECMPRRCSICVHAERESIDRALLRAEPYRNVAERFEVSLGPLSRHHAGGHLCEELVRAHQAEDLARADRLLVEIDGLLHAAKRILVTAEADGDLRTALLAIREARASAETMARVGALLPTRLDSASKAESLEPVPLLEWLAGRVASDECS